jgi:nucleoside-diphosphate-sugar epimerase
MKKIAITGANGFIGKSLCKTFSKLNRAYIGIVRSENSLKTLKAINTIFVGDINSNTDWNQSLENCEVIIHCAGIAHVTNNKDNLYDYYKVNTEGTKNLAEQATQAGVKRLVFLSSIKVNGENTDKINNRKKFYYKDIPAPQDVYARSKLEAEKTLWEISSRTGLEVVVVRLPLVYGYGAKGNLSRLIKLIKLGIPLPLSIIKNQRSMIGIDNLVNLLIRCIDHPKANGKTFLASDGADLSTPQLIKLIGSSMGRKVYLFPVPLFLLKILGSIFGKQKEIIKLTGSLRIDNNYAKEILDWTPPLSIEESIRKMIQDK